MNNKPPVNPESTENKTILTQKTQKRKDTKPNQSSKKFYQKR